MKIVDAPRPKSKAARFREVINLLLKNPQQAAYIDNYNDLHHFGRIVKSIGCKPTWQKQRQGGWLVWVRK